MATSAAQSIAFIIAIRLLTLTRTRYQADAAGRLLATRVESVGRERQQRYLWNERSVAQAIEYVLYGQGDDLPDFDD